MFFSFFFYLHRMTLVLLLLIRHSSPRGIFLPSNRFRMKKKDAIAQSACFVFVLVFVTLVFLMCKKINMKKKRNICLRDAQWRQLCVRCLFVKKDNGQRIEKMHKTCRTNNRKSSHFQRTDFTGGLADELLRHLGSLVVSERITGPRRSLFTFFFSCLALIT